MDMGIAINAMAAAVRARTLVRYRLVMVVRVDLMIECFVPTIPNLRESDPL